MLLKHLPFMCHLIFSQMSSLPAIVAQCVEHSEAVQSIKGSIRGQSEKIVELKWLSIYKKF